MTNAEPYLLFNTALTGNKGNKNSCESKVVLNAAHGCYVEIKESSRCKSLRFMLYRTLLPKKRTFRCFEQQFVLRGELVVKRRVDLVKISKI